MSGYIWTCTIPVIHRRLLRFLHTSTHKPLILSSSSHSGTSENGSKSQVKLHNQDALASPAKNICEKPLSIFQVKTEIESTDEERIGGSRGWRTRRTRRMITGGSACFSLQGSHRFDPQAGIQYLSWSHTIHTSLL